MLYRYMNEAILFLSCIEISLYIISYSIHIMLKSIKLHTVNLSNTIFTS